MRVNRTILHIVITIFFISFSSIVFGQQDELAFKKAVHFADSVYAKGDYENAKAAFQYAEHLKNDAYIQQRLHDIEIKIAETTTLNRNYNLALSEVRLALNTSNLEQAKEKLEYALSLKPTEQWPKEQLSEVNQKIDAQANIKQQFNDLLKEGDNFFVQKKYEHAKSSYEQAIKIIPTDVTAKTKLSEAITKLKDLNAEYKNKIANADNLYQANDLTEAKNAYLSALTLKPDQLYPKQKIEQIENILFSEAAINAELQAIVTLADQAFDNKDYQFATKKYREALDVLSSHKHSKSRLEEINQIIGEQEAQMLAYNESIGKANAHFTQKRYQEAKTEYQHALEIKSDESYPKEQINAIDQIFAQQMAHSENIERIIAAADTDFDASRWLSAKQKYAQVLQLEADNTYSKQRIKTIESIVNDINKNYTALVTKADNLFEAKKYSEALIVFEQALLLKPEETYPKEKILSINHILNNQTAIQNSYSEIIAQADAAFSNKEWQIAVQKYQTAIEIKPTEAYPKQQLIKAEKETRIQADIEKRYNETITNADTYYNGGKWGESITAYQTALKIKPNETYPSEQIILAKTKLTDLDNLNQNYKAYIAEGDALFKAKSWNDAIAKYTEALTLKPEENYPKTQTEKAQHEIDVIAASQAASQEAYTRNVHLADSLFALTKWNESITAYQTALKIKPNETYPSEQINKAQQNIKLSAELEANYSDKIANADHFFEAKDWEKAQQVYEQAKQLKQNEIYPQQQIALCNEFLRIEQEKAVALQQQLDNYNTLITQADIAFNNASWDEAISFYRQASAIKSNETYPQQQMGIALRNLEKIASDRKQYAGFIASGDEYFKQEQWKEAIEAYQKSLNLFPEQQYPKQQIAVANEQIASIDRINSQYNTLITQADTYFRLKEYEVARNNYKEALNLKPRENYAAQKLQEIENILDAEKAAENMQLFREKIAEANIFIGKKNYEAAIASLENALIYKLNDDFAIKKIAELQKILNDVALSKSQYAQLIADGDAAFNKENYQEAIKSYKNAMRYQPDEMYPRKKIVESERNMEYTPQRRQVLAKESMQRGEEAMVSSSYDVAMRAFGNAFFWYPENAIAPLDKMHSILTNLESGNEKQLLTNPLILTANRRGTIDLDIKPSEITEKAYLLFKVSGTYENNVNIFIRWGRLNNESGATVVTLVYGLDDMYYCADIKGINNGLSYIAIIPENTNLIIEEAKLVSK